MTKEEQAALTERLVDRLKEIGRSTSTHALQYLQVDSITEDPKDPNYYLITGGAGLDASSLCALPLPETAIKLVKSSTQGNTAVFKVHAASLDTALGVMNNNDMLIDSKTGESITKAKAPDGKAPVGINLGIRTEDEPQRPKPKGRFY